MKQTIFLIIIFFGFRNIQAQELPTELIKAVQFDRQGHIEEAQSLVNNYLHKVSDKNNYTAIVQALTIQSVMLTTNDSIIKAIENLAKATEISKKTDNKIQKSYVLMAKIWVDFYTNNYKNVVAEAKEALSLLPEHQEVILRIFLYTSIYNVYSQFGNWEEAKPYILKLKALESEAKNINFKFSADYNLSNYLKWKYNAHTDDVKLRDSIFNIYHQIHSNYRTGLVSINDFITVLFNEIGFRLTIPNLSNNERIKILESAQDSVATILPLVKKKKYFYEALNTTFLAQIQYEKENIDSTIYYLKQGNDFLKVANPSTANLKSQILNSIVALYEVKKDYKNAYLFEKEARIYSEKLYDVETGIFNKRIEAQYQLGEKNAEIARLKANEEWQKKMNYVYLGLLLLGGAAFLGYYKSYKFKLKYSSEKAQKLKLERDEAALQYKLNLEEQTRLQQEKEYLDIQHEQMKRELMLNTLHLEHKNNLLLHLSENAKEGNPLNLQRILREESNIDMDFEEVKTQIQDIHPSFFNTLMDKSQQKLTNLDLKYCAYLHLNIDTKQIAQLLNVEPKSVRMSKYRIKQKLGLDKDEDLEIYLKDIK